MKDLSADYTNYGLDKARIISMRPTLEGTSKLHMMVHVNLSEDDVYYYAVVDLDPAVTNYKSFLVMKQTDFVINHAAWFEPDGAPTFVLDPNTPSQVAYNSFSVGRAKPTDTKEWGIIFPSVLSSTLSCYNQDGTPDNWSWTLTSTISLWLIVLSTSNNKIDVNTSIPTFIPYTSSNFCVNQSDQKLEPWLPISSWSLTRSLFGARSPIAQPLTSHLQ